MDASAAVTGLLAAATKIHFALLPLPACCTLCIAARTFKLALAPLQPYVDGSKQTVSLVDVAHLVWILGGCVVTFSRLEKRVDRVLARDVTNDDLQRVMADADMSRALEILRLHTTSLTLLLGVWTR